LVGGGQFVNFKSSAFKGNILVMGSYGNRSGIIGGESSYGVLLSESAASESRITIIKGR
jgi:hypothetical protein